MKKAEGRVHWKRYGNTYRDERKRCVPTVLTSLTGETFVARYDELEELSTRLATNLRISRSLEFKRRLNTTWNGMVVGKIEEQEAVSSLTDTVQDDTTLPTQLASVLQVSQSCSLKEKHSASQKCKNSVKEEKKGDGITTVSANVKCRTENSVMNQVEHMMQIFLTNFTHCYLKNIILFHMYMNSQKFTLSQYLHYVI